MPAPTSAQNAARKDIDFSSPSCYSSLVSLCGRSMVIRVAELRDPGVKGLWGLKYMGCF